MVLWLVLLISTGLEVIPSIGKYSTGIIAGDYFLYLFFHVSVFYLYYIFLSKEHVTKKKPALLILYGLIFITIISLPLTYIFVRTLFADVFEQSGKKFFLAFSRQYLSILQTNIIYAVSGSLLKISLLWYENVMQQKESEKKYLKGELALLRSQINPKFLSNSLGNIKYLIEKKPDEAICSIENLSEIMSYMLYETSPEAVPLDDEINYIRNYLKLQEVMYPPGYLALEVSGDTGGMAVPPLLFMPFLENTFSISAAGRSEIPGIKISLNITGKTLKFKTICYVNEEDEGPGDEKVFSITSIRRFLDLQFGTGYNLESVEENNRKIVRLEVSLSS